MTGRIAVLGSLHLDYLVHLPYIPRKGETLKGRDLRIQPGGKGANQAYYAALMGAPTMMLGRVGDDMMGETQKAALAAANVDVSLLKVDPGVKSGMSVAMICDDSDYGAAIISGANMRVGKEDVDAAGEAILGASHLVMQYEIPLDTVAYAAKLARRAGVKVVVNAAPAYPGEEILAETDILIVNEIEAEMLLGIPGGNAAETLARLEQSPAPAVRIVTLGAAGVVYASEDESGFLPAHDVAVKDSHGAGDSFVGALCACLADGGTIGEAVAFGNAAAALSVANSGPRSTFTREMVREQAERLRGSQGS